MAKFAFLGSSYIARFERFCNYDMKIPGILRFFGVPGMRADNVPYSKIREIKHFCPDVVCFLLEGNNISDMSSPCGIFRHILRTLWMK